MLFTIPKEHTLPLEAENTKFWEAYSKSDPSKQKLFREAPDFVKYVWAGIPAQFRQKVWCNPVDVPPTRFTADDPSDAFKTEVDPEISFTLKRIISPDQDDSTLHTLIRTVLMIDAGIYGLETIRPGSVELISAMQQVTQQVSFTLQAYQWLSHRTSDLWTNDHETLDNWSLLLAEALARWAPTTANMLASAGVDAHDLSMLLREWMLSLLASRFPASLTHRCIDVALLDPKGSIALIGIVFGLILAARVKGSDGEETSYPSGPRMSIVEDTRESKTAEAKTSPKSDPSVLRQLLFAHMRVRPEDLASAWAYGYAFCRSKLSELETWIPEKLWKTAVSYPGVSGLEISEGVGSSTNQSHPHAVYRDTRQCLLRIWQLLEEITAARDAQLKETEQNVTSVPSTASSGTSSLATLHAADVAKLTSAEASLRSLLAVPATATPQVRDALTDVQRLLELLNAGSSPYAKSENEENNTVSYVPPPMYAHHPMHVDGNFVPRRVTANGMIKYSELYDYLELPCAHMEGYLLKAKNPSEAASTANLSRRFFTLNGPFLTVFKSHDALAPLKDLSIDLRGRTVCVVDNAVDGLYGLEIYTHKGAPLYVLFAQTEVERKKWAASLVHVAHMPRYISDAPQ